MKERELNQESRKAGNSEAQPRKEDAATQQVAHQAASEFSEWLDVSLEPEQVEKLSVFILSAIDRAAEEWKQSVEDRLDRIQRRLQNVPHY